MPDPVVVRQLVGIADPNNPGNVLVPNATNGSPVVKSDVTVFSPPTIGLWIGGAGDVAVKMAGGQTATFVAVGAGQALAISVTQVLATGTTATNIIRLW